MTNVRVRNLWDLLSSSLWFLPSAMTVVAIAVAVAAIAADRSLTQVPDGWYLLYSGGAEGARSVLSTIAGSMITVAGVAFSVTMVALSFASSELGPRLLRNFMRDRGNQIVLGTFIATFVYSLLVLRAVSESPLRFVPHIGVTGALFMALASLAVLIYFIHHVALTLQADNVISIVARDLDRSIESLYPETMGENPRPELLAGMEARERALRSEEVAQVAPDVSGYIQALAVDGLMSLAVKHDLLIRVLSRPGRYVLDGVAVAEIRPASGVDDRIRSEVRSAFLIGRTRTSKHDVEFALLQLVEVAVRALSPGVNDPFTAIACIDRLSTGVLHLMRREFPSRFRVDGEGSLRVIADRPDFRSLVDASFHQIRQCGAGHPAVTIHLLEMLTTLLEQATSDEHRLALEHHVALVRRAGVRETAEAHDRRDIVDSAAASGR